MIADSIAPKPRVIHYGDRFWFTDEELVYIGRAMPRQGLKASPWANPYRIGVDGDRAQVIALYRANLEGRLSGDRELVDELAELSGKVLMCWCSPAPCHGDVLAELADQIAAQKRADADYYAELSDAASY